MENIHAAFTQRLKNQHTRLMVDPRKIWRANRTYAMTKRLTDSVRRKICILPVCEEDLIYLLHLIETAVCISQSCITEYKITASTTAGVLQAGSASVSMPVGHQHDSRDKIDCSHRYTCTRLTLVCSWKCWTSSRKEMSFSFGWFSF